MWRCASLMTTSISDRRPANITKKICTNQVAEKLFRNKLNQYKHLVMQQPLEQLGVILVFKTNARL